MIKPRRIRWVGYVARRGTKRNANRVWWGSEKERDHYEDPDVGGRILQWMMEKWVGVAWAGLL
jgi:hypothetical protein